MTFRDFKTHQLTPHSVSFHPAMPAPVSPTYTTFSVPSPFSSGSSTSFPTRSPISEPFDSMSDQEHHSSEHTVVANDYTVGYPSSLPIYGEMPYISGQDFDYNMMNWSAPDVAMPKRQQQPVPHHYQQQYPQHVPARALPNDMERIKSLTSMYNSPAAYQQQHRSPTIHSPIPIVPSHIPSHTAQIQQSQSQSPQRLPRAAISNDALFDVDDWQTPAPPTSHHAQFSTGGYSNYAQAEPIRRTASDFSGSFRVKQEDTFSSLGTFVPQTQSPRQAHIFDLSAHPHPSQSQQQQQLAQQHQQHSQHSQSPHTQPSSLSPPYLSRAPPLQIQQQQQQFPMHPAELSPSALSDACVRYDGFGSSAGEYAPAPPAACELGPQHQGYAPYVGSVDSGYADVCDPRFVSGKDGEWRGCAEAMFVDGGAREGEGDADGGAEAEFEEDADAEGEDDLDGYASSVGAYPPPYQQQAQDRGSPDATRAHEAGSEADGEDDGETGESEEDIDDARDPEFVLRRRPRRHTYTATSAPAHAGAYGLRSTRYNPYPPSPTAGFDFAGAQAPPPLRARRSYSHTSTSPSDAELAGGGGAGGVRRRARPVSTLPVPVPVPNLTKKSRGRRVPTMEDFQDAAVQKAAGKKKGPGVGPGKGTRTYTCEVGGCGKLFARGEHLKRHVRSIHTYEKPHRCPYPGCGKDFSRHDNLGQHMRVHKDYTPPKFS